MQTASASKTAVLPSVGSELGLMLMGCVSVTARYKSCAGFVYVTVIGDADADVHKREPTLRLAPCVVKELCSCVCLVLRDSPCGSHVGGGQEAICVNGLEA